MHREVNNYKSFSNLETAKTTLENLKNLGHRSPGWQKYNNYGSFLYT